jgi:hypothetical protein
MQVTYGKGFEVQGRMAIRERIAALERGMRARPDLYDTECKQFPVTHFKAPGMIARQMLIPKGHEIIGKLHKHAHLNHITSGRVRVITEHGPMEIIGPHTFTSEVGTKRVVLALEDTIWTTFHLNPHDLDPDKEEDMKQLESEIIAKSHDELPQVSSHKDSYLEVSK